MIRRMLLLSLLVAAGLASTGCHGRIRRAFLFPIGPGCDPTYCADGTCGPCAGPACEPCGGPACGPTCGPVCGPVCEPPICPLPGPNCGGVCEPPCCGTCEPACGPCEPTCGPPCAAPCGPGACWPPDGPLVWLGRAVRSAFCCNGCGETYWGDWLSEPPNCCEPCDQCGNWTGGYAGYSGYEVAGHGVPATGGCSECAQSRGVATSGQPIVAQTGAGVPSVGAAASPTPRTAWRPRQTAPVQQYR